jgi:predicted Zn-dependent protease
MPIMKKYRYVLTAVVLGIVISCATNPFSGKKTWALVPNSEILPSAFAQYSSFLSNNKVLTNTKEAKLVESVGIKIKNAAERYLNANAYQDYLKDYRWEYKLVDSPEVNAWCMPGGKIVVYSGILPITKTEAGLATEMGHEVAHALANHGQQRMSAGLIQQTVAAGAQVAVSNENAETQALTMQAYGIGSQVLGMLPFSRSHETEADEIGLTLMAIAGYNPEEAVLFWGRMSAKSGGGAPPEFLSTHPSDQTRMNNLKRLIPIAKANAAKFGVNFNKK